MSKVMKWLASLIILVSILQAETIDAKYKIEYGIFGKMGESEARLVKKDGHYKIKMIAYATGLAKVLSGGRVEVYESEGTIMPDGTLRPDVFRKDISRKGKKRIKIYTFNRKDKKIEYKEERFRDGKLESESSGILPYFAENDIISLYFNVKTILKNCQKPFDKMLKAVGAQKNSGNVRVSTVVGDDIKKVKDLLGEASCYLKVTVYQKLFGSKGGELYLGLRPDFVVKKAVLKDVIMFGDIRGNLTQFSKHN
ncbi:DUF3108 domain-containing protein [Hydrogenimonas thermophila]|uniref:DUF3108 domain-containing protein n=1 Tax=Hydrogenimonas thermophila TaxID=223786 RepID=A0A1I5M9T8_9BACT|nr:DUF3108 domain-containing protein [Hydrogenimonas thermophila]SFP05771.1 Protein of unknown function [Hydrogenimonas thermophila]